MFKEAYYNMCVIDLIPEGRYPSLKTLKAQEKENPHGGGIAWLEGDKVHFKKNIKAEEIHQILMQKRPRVCVIHFRIKSIGETIPELTHPFIVSHDSPIEFEGVTDRVLFHNGTWSDYDDVSARAFFSGKLEKIPDGPISDSRMMAVLVSYYGESFLKLYPRQRVTILDKNGIRHYGDDWKTYKGVMCSNLNFVESKKPVYSYVGFGDAFGSMYDTDWFSRPKSNAQTGPGVKSEKAPVLPGPDTSLLLKQDKELLKEQLWAEYDTCNNPKRAQEIQTLIDAIDNEVIEDLRKLDDYYQRDEVDKNKFLFP